MKLSLVSPFTSSLALSLIWGIFLSALMSHSLHHSKTIFYIFVSLEMSPAPTCTYPQSPYGRQRPIGRTFVFKSIQQKQNPLLISLCDWDPIWSPFVLSYEMTIRSIARIRSKNLNSQWDFLERKIQSKINKNHCKSIAYNVRPFYG